MSEGPPIRLDPVTDLLLLKAGDIQAPVAVLDDVEGQLTGVLVERGHQPRVWCDDIRAEQFVCESLRCTDPHQAVTEARTVLWRLPRAVAAVEEYGEIIARHARPDVHVVAAGRDKHLSRSMNAVLAKNFTSVTVSLGHRKARAFLASGPLRPKPSWPRSSRLASLDLEVVAHGATFNTNRLDRGTALLVESFDRLPSADTAIDLGCGSGILATLLALRGPRVHAVDVTWSAMDATRLTAQANHMAVDTHRRDGFDGWPGRVDLVVTNPPFHVGAAKDTSPTRRLFTDAGRILSDGGELWCVYNAHLPYLPWLRQAIGPTRIMARNSAYLVTRSVRAPRSI